jgi:pepF/M3 family oligoendopeptidase
MSFLKKEIIMQSSSKNEQLPRWDLHPIYPDFESAQYSGDMAQFKDTVAKLRDQIDDAQLRDTNPADWLHNCITLINTALDLYTNLEAYTYCRYSVATTDEALLKRLNKLEAAVLPLKNTAVRFRNALALISDTARAMSREHERLKEFAFYISEELMLQGKQMSAEEEDLAADLTRAGSDAWSRLQETVSSTLSALWDKDTGERKTTAQLRALAHDNDRRVREKAFRSEIELWKSAEIPLAYALNGVKGFSVILNKRRNYENTLEKSLIQSRISKKTLGALTAVMEESLPLFRSYLQQKARIIGVERCAFYDLFAPVGKNEQSWTFEAASSFITEQFKSFSDELADFAEHAFESKWIDAEPRKGKIDGAYCISMPRSKESRILCNFNGSFSGVTTVAHELGHGYHHHVLKDAAAVHREYPMTLAETASSFCETIVFNNALKDAGGNEALNLLESTLQDSTQVIVDILSRYRFETKLLDQRVKEELSPAELCRLMTEAQNETYADGLDQEQLHPYMWAVKPHYYSANLAFYNFPYAFGHLFALALFSLYGRQGKDFPPRYRQILQETGRASAETICRNAGFDIETEDFWRQGIAVIEEQIRRYRDLSAGR